MAWKSSLYSNLDHDCIDSDMITNTQAKFLDTLKTKQSLWGKRQSNINRILAIYNTHFAIFSHEVRDLLHDVLPSERDEHLRSGWLL